MSDLINRPVEITGEKIELVPDNGIVHIGCAKYRIAPSEAILRTVCGQYKRNTRPPYNTWSEVPEEKKCIVCLELSFAARAKGQRACANTGICQQPNTCKALQKGM